MKSEIATFMDVFPEGTVWSNDIGGEGYDIVLLGQAESTTINVEEMQSRLDRDDHALVKQSLQDVFLGSANSMLSTYGGQGSDLGEWMVDAEINSDHNLRLQYLAGMGLNEYVGGPIYDAIREHRKFPENLFQGSDESLDTLWRVLNITPSVD